MTKLQLDELMADPAKLKALVASIVNASKRPAVEPGIVRATAHLTVDNAAKSIARVGAEAPVVVSAPAPLDVEGVAGLAAGASAAGPSEPTNLRSADLTADDCERGSRDSTLREWTEEETKLLLDKYHAYLGLVGPMKTFKTKKAMWRAISLDIEDALGLQKSPKQCQNRFQTVKRRTSHQDLHNRASGAEPTQVPFYQMGKIAAVDHSLEPYLLRGPGRVVFKSTSVSTLAKMSAARKATSKAMSEMMWKIHQDREQQRERRHQEKMNLIRSFLSAQ
nr:uncharacterized protein LOC129387231 [Dermacentor andersoni]